MADDKKAAPGPPPGKDLTSKIARAYRRAQPEPREKPKLDQNDIQNPELDQFLDRMIQMQKGQRPEEETPVASPPAPPMMRIPSVRANSGEEYEGAAVPAPRRVVEPQVPKPPQSGIKRQPDRRDRTNPYLLLAVVLLLGVVAWQQWGVHPPGATMPASVPAPPAQPQPQVPPQSQPQVPLQSQPTPEQEPVSTTVVPAQQSTPRPTKKPAVRPSTARPSMAVERTVLRPPQPLASHASGPPIAPYESLTDRPIPVLPSFSSLPPKPGSTR